VLTSAKPARKQNSEFWGVLAHTCHFVTYIPAPAKRDGLQIQPRIARKEIFSGGTTMTTSPATPADASPELSKIGLIVEVSGASAFLGGAVLSIHHYAIALLTIGGAVAFFVGKKMRGSTAL
jgi:hypothetical protein